MPRQCCGWPRRRRTRRRARVSSTQRTGPGTVNSSTSGVATSRTACSSTRKPSGPIRRTQSGGALPRVARLPRPIRAIRTSRNSLDASPQRASPATGNGAPAGTPCARGQRLAPEARATDWNTLAIARSSPREVDATQALLVELAVTPDLDRSCHVERVRDVAGEPLRVPAQACGPHQSATARSTFLRTARCAVNYQVYQMARRRQ